MVNAVQVPFKSKPKTPFSFSIPKIHSFLLNKRYLSNGPRQFHRLYVPVPSKISNKRLLIRLMSQVFEKIPFYNFYNTIQYNTIIITTTTTKFPRKIFSNKKIFFHSIFLQPRLFSRLPLPICSRTFDYHFIHIYQNSQKQKPKTSFQNFTPRLF